MKRPELSIIVPVLDEIDVLPNFLSELSKQRFVSYEIIIVDGGSRDGSLQWLKAQTQDNAHLKIVSSAKGRGCQLNTGVLHATAPWLLFLHADSQLSEDLVLRKAIDLLDGEPCRNLAGHFPLRFERSRSGHAFAFYFYEAKTATGRRETIHGDQGFLLHRHLFKQVGAFDESLPVMEDTDYAERIRHVGTWVTLPFVLTTSARRFEAEGLWQRQLLGALVMCFRSIGWLDFLHQAPHVYRLQKNADKLDVAPFFKLIRTLLHDLPDNQRKHIWFRSGCYVRQHAWQLFFCVDALMSYLVRTPSCDVRPRLTRICEPVFDFITANKAGCLISTLALKIWFHSTAFILSKVVKL